MNWSRRLGLSLVLTAALVPGAAVAQKAIKVGYPVILSGPGALIGEPSLKGAQMYVEELNAKGGVLGRKVELVVRDTKGNADEAVRVARDMILRENVDFLVGTLTSAEGPAVSPVAKENKVVFVVPVVKTEALIDAAKHASLHLPHLLEHHDRRANGGRDHRQVERQAGRDDQSRLRLRPRGDRGPSSTHLKKIRPDIEIVDQQWPKLGEADYTPFINAQMSKKPEAVLPACGAGIS